MRYNATLRRFDTTLFKKQEGGASNRRIAWGKVHLCGKVMLLVAALALAGGLFLLSSCSPGQSVPPALEAPGSVNATPQREFPSFVYNSAQVLQAYETAMKIPEVLPLMPCYCGCGEAHDHKNLKDCFFKEDGSLNDHGAFCEVCDMEVADIAKWQGEGYSLEQIRGLIDEKYPRYGEPTDTALFTQPGASPTPELPTAGFTTGPRIFFSEDSVDLGEAPNDVPLNYTFHFKNVGDAPLHIIDTWAKALVGCCPPIPVVGATTLQPGEESTLLIGETAHHGTGSHQFEITVKSNDPVEPEKKLYLTVHFLPKAKIDTSPPPENRDARP